MKLISRLILLACFTLTIFTYILPVEATSTNEEATQIQQQDEIIVNGTKINAYPIVINNCTLVPARDVCKNLGFTISWNNNEETATINSKNMKSTVKIGQDLYTAQSTIAIGMTAPISLGSGPLLINDKLYIPAEIFRILQGNDPNCLVYTDHQIILNTVE
ncbi:copper amine oxidase N-terminal domain-containing protein [uncultured Megamonas sp.]|uniref:copper amine oxidase N-terminal domain-containing protein n=1 Tax=uncultured Megamonas sp. TaxID=286140 RepID=UPI0025F0567D|nr:copper amine oxidase N-terminal domain-containing protein [uncultured Megamonas sp.]